MDGVGISSGSLNFDEVVLTEVNARLDYLVAVGLGYLTLDRQSRIAQAVAITGPSSMGGRRS